MSKSPFQLAQKYITAYKVQDITLHELNEALDSLVEYEQNTINQAYAEGHYDHSIGANQSNYYKWRFENKT